MARIDATEGTESASDRAKGLPYTKLSPLRKSLEK